MACDLIVYHWVRYPGADGTVREFLCLCPAGESHDAPEDEPVSPGHNPDTKET